MNQEIKVGDYVRNCKTRKYGHVSAVSPDGKRITVLTINRTFASWSAKNVQRDDERNPKKKSYDPGN